VIASPQHPLELLAADVFRNVGFRVEYVALEEPSRIITAAEDPFSVAGVIGADNWADIRASFDDLAIGFANWVNAREPGLKQWDVYFVALIQQPLIGDEELTSAEGATRNLQAVRRIIRTGVAPSADEVRKGLAPLLPLEVAAAMGSMDDPLKDLVGALRLQGVPPDVAAMAVANFRAEKEGS
jgi:hypothetical protein